MTDNNMCNTTNLCKGNYGINRKRMPQFTKKTLKKFIESLRKKKINSRKKKVHVKNLKATQNEIYHPAIKDIQKKIKTCRFNPDVILVSKNNYVIDGHHRWASLKDCYNNPKSCKTKKCSKFNPYISTYKIDLDPINIINYANKFNGIYNVKFSEKD
jgi:hypothetical protein